MQEGSIEVTVKGVRLDWHPLVQYSMLHYVFPLFKILEKKMESNKSNIDRRNAVAGVKQDTRNALQLCMSDLCLIFTCSECSVIGLEVNGLNLSFPDSKREGPDEHNKEVRTDTSLAISGLSIHRIHAAGARIGLVSGHTSVSSRFALLPRRIQGQVDGNLNSLLSESLRTDKFLSIDEMNLSLAIASIEPFRVSTRIQLVNLNIMIPWCANLSTHGRREGYQGRWNGTRLRGRESLAYWTDLGIMGNEALLTVKTFQLYIMPWLRGPNYSSTVTDFPEFLKEIQLEINGMRVLLEDDPWEVWVGAIFRLRADEANEEWEQRQRLSVLVHKNVDEAQLKVVEHELQRLNASLWKQRVRALKASSAFLNARPLFDVCFKSISCHFIPRSATFLMDHLLILDGSGLLPNIESWPKLDTLLGGELRHGLISGLSVRVRDHCEPVFQVFQLNFSPDPNSLDTCVLAATEEVCPPTHMKIVERWLHPALSPTLIPRSFASTKIWGRIDISAIEPRITVGPSVLPAVAIISNTISGVSPPGEDPSPSLSSWDKLRLLLHGVFSLRIDKACIRLLSDRDPHRASECLQLRGKGICVTNKDDSRTDSVPGEVQLWRLRIACDKMQCDVESEKEDMTSAMLLQRPLFKAARLETTITMHWKCLGPAAAHHYKQMLVSESNKAFIATPPHIRHTDRRRPATQVRHIPRSYPLATDKTSEHNDDFEDADEIPGLKDQKLVASASATNAFDTYRNFRSTALAMTIRLSATETHTVLYIKTLRWILDFMDAVEKEADPVRRYIGSIDKDGKRRKKFVPRSSLSLHTKAVQAS